MNHLQPVQFQRFTVGFADKLQIPVLLYFGGSCFTVDVELMLSLPVAMLHVSRIGYRQATRQVGLQRHLPPPLWTQKQSTVLVSYLPSL